MASSCARLVKPGRCGIPCEPTSSVMRVVLYLACSVADTNSLYFASFFSLAPSKNISKQTALQAITASESHPTRPCLDVSQWVQCEGGRSRWPPGHHGLIIPALTQGYFTVLQGVDQDLSFLSLSLSLIFHLPVNHLHCIARQYTIQ